MGAEVIHGVGADANAAGAVVFHQFLGQRLGADLAPDRFGAEAEDHAELLRGQPCLRLAGAYQVVLPRRSITAGKLSGSAGSVGDRTAGKAGAFLESGSDAEGVGARLGTGEAAAGLAIWRATAG